MKHEFLQTNIYGGYSSTDGYLGNTRKYHGLLVAGIEKLQRLNILNRVLETVTVNGTQYPLSTTIYSDNFRAQDSTNFIKRFNPYEIPIWHYEFPETKVEKRIYLSSSHNSLTIAYKIISNVSGELATQPLVTYRDLHHIKPEIPFEEFRLEHQDNLLVVNFNKEHSLKITFPGGKFNERLESYFNFYYEHEYKRGYEHLEDLFSLGSIIKDFSIGETQFNIEVDFITTMKKSYSIASAHDERQHEIVKNEYSMQFEFSDSIWQRYSKRLWNSAQALLIKDGGIIAGYHWFGEWARDTFISFKGILLDTGNQKVAKESLQRWLDLYKDGFIPNRTIENDYRSLDGTFWMIISLWQYYQATKDKTLLMDALVVLRGIDTSYRNGTNNIFLDSKGFLIDRNHNDAFTWMDAKVQGTPVINRSGKAVEIQALWYNAVCIILEFAKLLDQESDFTKFKTLKQSLETNFGKQFWNQEKDYVYDCINEEHTDSTIRPNAIIMLSLPFQLLTTNQQIAILKTCEQELLTPVGLRSLSKNEPNYHGEYEGNQNTRDLAYHQGTIWFFLFGMYLKSYIQVYNHSQEAYQYAQTKLNETFTWLSDRGLETFPEIFSGNSLQPDGCLLQAWSVATLLEVLSLINTHHNSTTKFN